MESGKRYIRKFALKISDFQKMAKKAFFEFFFGSSFKKYLLKIKVIPNENLKWVDPL